MCAFGLAACGNDTGSFHAFGTGDDGGGVDTEVPAQGSDSEGSGSDAAGDSGDSSGAAAGTSGSDGSTTGGEQDWTGTSGPSSPSTANDDAFVVPNNALPLEVDAASGVLANDEGTGLSVNSADLQSARGASVTVDADGALHYDAPAWVWGEDSFSYETIDANGETQEATVRVIVRPTSILLSHVALGFGGFAIDGEGAGDWAGSAVAGGADLTGDGVSDLVVGAFGATPNGGVSGRSYVVRGGGNPSPFLADAADARSGFAIDGEAAADLSGDAVGVVGDVDGDGIDDILVGARGSDIAGTDSGRAYVVFGGMTTGVTLADVAAGTGGFAIDGETGGDRCGLAVAGAGDVDGDGRGDLIVAAPYAPGGSEFGRVYVVFGKADGLAVALSDVAAGIGGFVIDGEDDGDRAGASVAAGGDIDGDGLSDIVVGAPGANAQGPSSGRVYVVFGKADGESVPLANVVAGDGGFAIDGEAAADQAGASVGGAIDVDGDGLHDVIIGAPGAGADAGRAYVVRGKSDGDPVLLSNVSDGGAGFRVDAGSPNFAVGSSVAGLGDTNGDGLDDFVLGAPGANDSGDASGRAYVVYGKVGAQPVDVEALATGDGTLGYVVIGATAGDQMGRAVGPAGDIDGDGRSDILLGAPGASEAGPSAGRVAVVGGVVTEP